jgi:hypothetical protein
VNTFEGDPDAPTFSGTTGGAGKIEQRSGQDDCKLPPTRMAVYIQEVRYMSHWDGLFGGGPEFYFCRGELVYNSNGTQVVGAPNHVRVALRRRDKGNWVTVSALWDSRWEFLDGVREELEQQCGLYEDDNGGSTTIGLNGSVKGNVKLPEIGGVETTIGASVSHTFTNNYEVIYNQQFDRCWFISTNTSNQGLGVRNGRAVRGVGGADAVYWSSFLITLTLAYSGNYYQIIITRDGYSERQLAEMQ